MSFRAIMFGDSFVQATGASWQGHGLSRVAGDFLDFPDWWGSGEGGTGYLATSSGTKPKLFDRLDEDLLRWTALGSADVVVVAMGLNDITPGLDVTAQANACFDYIRANAPNALVFVIGPWDVNAPAPPAAGYSTRKAEIVAAVGSRLGFYFLDPQGVAFTKSDGTHPDTTGHLKLGKWINSQIRRNVLGVWYETETQDLVARFTTPPTTLRKGQTNDLVFSLINSGVWSKLDGLVVFASADSQAARRNWVQDLYNPSTVNGPTFAADRGYTGDGAASYLDTGFDPTTAGGKFALNSAHLGVFQLTFGSGAGVQMGNANARLGPNVGGPVLSTRGNEGTGALNTPVSLPGYGAWSRTAAGSYVAYNGTTDTSNTVSVTSTSLTATSLTLCRANGFTLNNSQIAAAHWGSGLTSAELKAMRDALTTYMQAVGAA